MAILTDRPENDGKLTREEIQECNKLALRYLVLDDLDLRNKKILHSLKSVYYKESETGGALMVCKDGSLLFAEREIVPLSRHKQAFEGGLRSNKEILKERKQQLQE